jgi:replication factor A1
MSSIEESGSKEFVKVESLTPSSRGVNIIVKVVSKTEAREVSGRGGRHRVADALVGDETGCIYLTLWDENIDGINEEETISITNGYVNLFRGNMRLNIGRYGSFEVITEEVIGEVNTENNLSRKRYEERRRYRPFGTRYGGGRGYRRRRY